MTKAHRAAVSASLSHGSLYIVLLPGDFVRLYPHILVDNALADTLVDSAADARPVFH